MRTNTLSFVALASAVASAQNLSTVLAGQPSLSVLVDLLGQNENITEYLASQPNVTLYAPNDDALESIVANGGIFSVGEAGSDPTLVEQTLRYHLSRGVIRSDDITVIPQFPHGYVNYSTGVLDGEVSGSNVTGGQVVQLSLDQDGNAIVTSALKSPSKVVTADIEFDNGVIHIIDELLTIPLSISETLISGNFTALAGAATQAGLVQTLQGLSDITIFCPNNDAFRELASSGADISDEQLADILQYHVVQGTVGYSTALSNTSLPTLNGEEVQITITDDGAVFANNARVINTDILIDNGVLHVIDEVLNPATPGFQDTTPAATTSLAAAVPFTSEVQGATSVFSNVAATTSYVAEVLVTATPSAAGNVSQTASGGPAVYTGGAVLMEEAGSWTMIVGCVALVALFC